jgi:hypothetical protein
VPHLLANGKKALWIKDFEESLKTCPQSYPQNLCGTLTVGDAEKLRKGKSSLRIKGLRYSCQYCAQSCPQNM